jgi:NAD(P)-dependent dehydrogenase (short-subunit alcohol dehydrogenase family)
VPARWQPAPEYSISRAPLNALTRFPADTGSATGVLVNAVDPGWVRAEMAGPSAPRSVEEGCFQAFGPPLPNRLTLLDDV